MRYHLWRCGSWDDTLLLSKSVSQVHSSSRLFAFIGLIYTDSQFSRSYLKMLSPIKLGRGAREVGGCCFKPWIVSPAQSRWIRVQGSTLAHNRSKQQMEKKTKKKQRISVSQPPAEINAIAVQEMSGCFVILALLPQLRSRQMPLKKAKPS